LPSYTQTARDRIVDLVVRYNRTFGGTSGTHAKSTTSSLVNLLLGTPPPRSAVTPSPTPSPSASPGGSEAVESIAPAPPKLSSAERQKVEADVEKMIVYMQHQLPAWSEKVWNILKKS